MVIGADGFRADTMYVDLKGAPSVIQMKEAVEPEIRTWSRLHFWHLLQCHVTHASPQAGRSHEYRVRAPGISDALEIGSNLLQMRLLTSSSGVLPAGGRGAPPHVMVQEGIAPRSEREHIATVPLCACR